MLRKISFIFLSFSVIALVGCQNNDSQNSSIKDYNTEQQVSDNSTTWQGYENIPLGFFINFPDDWVLDEKNSPSGRIAISNPKNNAEIIEITVKKNNSSEIKTTEEWTKSSEFPFENTEDYEEITLNGIKGLIDRDLDRIIVVKNDKVYIIENGTGMERKVVPEKLFNEMLSTFKML